MNRATIIEDLYAANAWAWQRLLKLCEGLSDEQLDAPREMGFGSLRATLFHMFVSEQIWLERWKGVAWRPFPMQPSGESLGTINDGMLQVACERQGLLNEERASGWRRLVTYRDSKGDEYRKPLDELLMHVANHGVHHRAQALNYLKSFGRTVPAGLDYLFYRLARPSVVQDDATVAPLRAFGLEINSAPGVEVIWDPERVRRNFAYHDWANARVLEAAARLDDAALDRSFDLGPGSIRQTLVHLKNVEPMWLKVWREGSAVFTPSVSSPSLGDLQSAWLQAAHERDDFLAALDEAGAQRIVSLSFGNPPVKFRVIESIVQICVHGTHHRAQLINMLRHSGQAPPALDYAVWIPNQPA